MKNETTVNSVNSPAEDLFVQLFCETFGPDKAEKLYIQYPFADIYGKQRYIDFALLSGSDKIAIEIDGETYHNPSKVSENKYIDDLLKQNSLTYQGWMIYRWVYNQLKNQPDRIKDELYTFLGDTPDLKAIENYLPAQKGKSFELRDYQQEAIDSLKSMRERGETIALLYHATGVGKTVTACTDAKNVGGRTLFLVNALKLADQAKDTFAKIWSEATLGEYTGQEKIKDTTVVFATIQTISKHCEEFAPDEFDYIIIDECHHAASKSYQAILSYFKPKFILGLTATPERADGQDMLELFQNVAHKMDLRTAVEQGILAPIRCVRVKTDIDLSDVRIHGIKYDAQDLESKLFVPERNELIVNTYLKYARGKKAVVFCTSVNHAAEIARLLKEEGVNAEGISGSIKVSERNSILQRYEHGDIDVLCACDLLNEGWDSPHTQVLFMARPTMSKTIYMQQLGRGTRKCENKSDLLVFDFVDNANMFKMPYSLHRTLNMSEYRPFEYVLAPEYLRKHDPNMTYSGEKPVAYLDTPINAADYEVVDLFNWQTEVQNMISQLEFVRMVNVQSETVERYIREGKIVPDLAVPVSENRFFNYFREDTVKSYAEKYGWDLITQGNIKSKFMEFVSKMDMSFSYKPILLKAMMRHANEDGCVALEDIVDYFKEYYEGRAAAGLVVEKPSSIFAKGGYTDKDVEKNILSNPFKRFADMRFFQRCKDVTMVRFNPWIYKKLDAEDFKRIHRICDKKLEEYYARFK